MIERARGGGSGSMIEHAQRMLGLQAEANREAIIIQVLTNCDAMSLLYRHKKTGGVYIVSREAAEEIERLREALERIDEDWTSLFPSGPDEPDIHKHMSLAVLVTAWRIVRAALSPTKAQEPAHE